MRRKIIELKGITKAFDGETVHSLITVGSGSIAESVFMRIGFLLNGRLIAGVSTSAYATNQIVQQISSLTLTLPRKRPAICSRKCRTDRSHA